jgi:hypothetical protein
MATTRPLEGFLDSVEFVSALDGTDEITMVGWALSARGEIQTVVVTINKGLPDELRERAQYGLARADVRLAFPDVPQASNCGFKVLFRARGFSPEKIVKIENIECAAVLASGETLMRAYEIPPPKSVEQQLEWVRLPSQDRKLFGFLEFVSLAYIGEGKTGLVLTGWILHAEKPISGLTFPVSTGVKYGLEHADLGEPFRTHPQAGCAGFRAIFDRGDFEADQSATFRVRVTLQDGTELETVFPPAIIASSMGTLIPQSQCLPMHRSRKSSPSDFCFGDVLSVRKVWLGRRRIGYYITGWLLAPQMSISDVWLLAEGRNCDMFHFGYPFRLLEVSYPTEKGSKGWFTGLLQAEDWHASELTCRIVARTDTGEEFYLEFPSRSVDTAFFRPARDRAMGARKTTGVHQCFFDDRFKNRLDPGFIPYFNERVSRFFENDVIVELIRAGKHKASDYFGVFSWRFSEKIPLRSQIIFDLMQEDGYEADVYSFFEGTHSGLGPEGHNIWTLGETYHPGLVEAGEILLKRLGMRVDLRHLTTPVIYQNHFICRSDLYERYVHELLQPAIRGLSNSNDRELQKAISRDAQYVTNLKPAVSAEVFGRPYFSLEPFLCERLFSTWAALQSLNVRHIFCAKIPGQ